MADGPKRRPPRKRPPGAPHKYNDSLRGYSFPIHQRDGWRCVYCGFDGSIWPNWLSLTSSHLLPRDHADYHDMEFRVTACIFCAVVHNQTQFDVEGKDAAELIEMKKPYVLERREEYRRFWAEEVRPLRLKQGQRQDRKDGANGHA